MTDKFEVYDLPSLRKCTKYVRVNNCDVGGEKDVLMTKGVEECLVITLYAPEMEKGALAHITSWGQPHILTPKRVIDTLTTMLGVGRDYRPLEASLSGEFRNSIRPSEKIKKILKDRNIPIIGEDLGESYKRSVFLFCNTGQVEVYRKMR